MNSRLVSCIYINDIVHLHPDLQHGSHFGYCVVLEEYFFTRVKRQIFSEKSKDFHHLCKLLCAHLNTCTCSHHIRHFCHKYSDDQCLDRSGLWENRSLRKSRHFFRLLRCGFGCGVAQSKHASGKGEQIPSGGDESFAFGLLVHVFQHCRRVFGGLGELDRF